MSQGGRSDTSDFSAVGRLQEGEVVEHVFDERRCSGNRGREYLCRLVDSEPRWLAAKDVSGDNLTVWEAGEAARVDRQDYERAKKSRAAKREHEKPTTPPRPAYNLDLVHPSCPSPRVARQLPTP